MYPYIVRTALLDGTTLPGFCSNSNRKAGIRLAMLSWNEIEKIWTPNFTWTSQKCSLGATWRSASVAAIRTLSSESVRAATNLGTTSISPRLRSDKNTEVRANNIQTSFCRWLHVIAFHSVGWPGKLTNHCDSFPTNRTIRMIEIATHSLQTLWTSHNSFSLTQRWRLTGQTHMLSMCQKTALAKRRLRRLRLWPKYAPMLCWRMVETQWKGFWLLAQSAQSQHNKTAWNSCSSQSVPWPSEP